MSEQKKKPMYVIMIGLNSNITLKEQNTTFKMLKSITFIDRMSARTSFANKFHQTMMHHLYSLTDFSNFIQTSSYNV